MAGREERRKGDERMNEGRAERKKKGREVKFYMQEKHFT